MSRRYGFGIIGAGAIGAVHARAIRELPNAHLAGVFDQAPERAQAFCATHGGQAFDKLETFLHDPSIHVVTIGTPSGSHMEPTVAAAAAGKHVICEKPLEVSLDRIDTMITAHEQAGTLLGGVFNQRYEPVFRAVRQVVASGRLGRLVCGAGHVPWFRTQAYYDQGGWRGTWKFDGGGALMNQGAHTVDMLLWLMGCNVRKVTAFTALLGHTGLEVEDTVTAALEFDNGALGMLSATTAASPGLPARVEIMGTTGTVICDTDGLRVLQISPPDPNDSQLLKEFSHITPAGGAADPAAFSFINHSRNFAAFLEALESGRTPEISGREARRAVAIVQAVYQSARIGHPVTL